MYKQLRADGCTADVRRDQVTRRQCMGRLPSKGKNCAATVIVMDSVCTSKENNV
jgi:hypothetical protein